MTMAVRSWIWRGLRATVGAAVDPDAGDPRALKRRTTVARDWATAVDGRAPRLKANETINVSRHGRFAEVDPLVTAEGWRNPWKAGVVTAWIIACGATAAVGYWGRRGPLAALRRDEQD